MKKFLAIITCFTLLTLSTFTLFGCIGSTVSITIDKENTGVDVDDTMYGIFLEDISYACDGGLVSNLVNNGSFEYTHSPLSMWEFEGSTVEITRESPLNSSNPTYVTLAVDNKIEATNLGYVEYYDYLTDNYNEEKMSTPDMGFQKDVSYSFSCYLKNIDFLGNAKVKLSSSSNNEYYPITLPSPTDGWVKVSTTITSKETEDGALTICFEGNGDICLDFAVLESEKSYGYGTDEWKYVSLRNDLYTALDNLSPAFVRFPGGCLAEGDSLENLFSWKNTIGPLENRSQFYNIWKDDDNGKTYNNTFAMGYQEYFQLCADLNAEPLPILNAGMICQFAARYNANYKSYSKGKMSKTEWESYLDTVALRPGTEAFDSYVNDILDLIEYANGDITTKWGAVRAANGSTEPFNMKYIGIGNENWGELYWRNFDAIYQVLKVKHPEITVVSSAGYSFSGERYEQSWEIINEKYTDTLVDEHYYTSANKLFNNNDRYDNYERTGATVFVGEYAASSQGFGKLLTKNNLWAAIEEAGYLTSLERNADLVKMASYAPTFAKINSQCWEINMIWFDSQNIVLTPNYYVQMLYANNTGNTVLNTDLNSKGLHSVTTYDEATQSIYIKLVNSNKSSFEFNIALNNFSNLNKADMLYLSDEKKGACNEIGSTTIIPDSRNCSIVDNTVTATVDGYSINVIRIFYGDNDGSTAFSLPNIPSNMTSEHTEYTRFYTTPQTLMAIFIPIAVILIACATTLGTSLIKKYLLNKKNTNEHI